MKKFISLFIFLACCSAYSQSLSLFDVDTSSFPTIKAKFFAFDKDGKQLLNLSPSDFEVQENGQPRTVSLVSCQSSQAPTPLSSVLVMDVSSSMCLTGLDIEKAAANAWIDILPLGQSDCAITSFSDINYINQDFTKDKIKLVDAINSLACMGGTDYNAAMIDAMAGGILIAKNGIYKRVIVFLSDGGPNSEPNTAQIISQAITNNISIYCITIGMSAPQCMKDLSNQTGGLYFENIRTKEEAEECYRKILLTSQSGDQACQIEWQSVITCGATDLINVEVKLSANNKTAKISYKSSNNSVAKLEFNPSSVKFINVEPGKKKDTTITITARNANFNVTNITSSNPAYWITPTGFSLGSDESKNLTVSYLPADSGYSYSKFAIKSDICQTQYYASGGYLGKKPKIQTLKLIHPNGGQVFVVGKDTVITWEGVLPEEKVKIDYTTNNGTSWTTLADSTTGLSYKWRVPKTPSNQCLARVTAKSGYVDFTCEGGEVEICNQVWMVCNLDVDTYRNGDPIPEVQDSMQWANLTTGAWCNYNNDPAMGALYGKLYNWYAVNDPRGLAPIGWHVPSDSEWTVLETCLGGSDIAGGKLKITGTIEGDNGLWSSPNTGATNSSGFFGNPGGYRYSNGNYYYVNYNGDWWSSTEDDIIYAWGRDMGYGNANMFRISDNKVDGFSVRCVKDK